MRLALTADRASHLAACVGDLESMAGTKIPDPGNPKAGGFVRLTAEGNELMLRAGLHEHYLAAAITTPADVIEEGSAWVATLPLADLLTKRPPQAAEVQLVVTDGRIEASFHTDAGRTIRHRTAAAGPVEPDTDLPTITTDSDPVFSVSLAPELVANLAGQVRQHDEHVANRSRVVWLTFESDQLRMEAWVGNAEATAVDFPLAEPSGLAGQVWETSGVLLGRALARLGKAVDSAPGRMVIQSVRLADATGDREDWALILTGGLYRFVLPMEVVQTDSASQATIGKLRTLLATDTTIAVQVPGADGLVDQICRESTRGLHNPVVALDFHCRHGQSVLAVHVTDDVSSESAAAEVYSGEYEAAMSAPLNRRFLVRRKMLLDALQVLRRSPDIRLHLEPPDAPGSYILGVTPARHNGSPITEFQASDIRTLIAGIATTLIRLPAYDPDGPVPHL